MLQLRDYQRASIDALYAYWAGGGGNGLIVLPTGGGKALVIAKIIEELLADYPDMRILNVTHSKTLVEQNFKEFVGLSPFAPAGIYSAGLNRRDRNAQVLFCGIQSVANKVAALGQVDLVIVDEAHAISRKADTQYGKFFTAIGKANPDSRIVGTTATAYRMDSGMLTDGDGALFDDIVYEISITDLIDRGYLTRLSNKNTETTIDLKGVGTRGGEFVPGQMARAADKTEITEAAVREALMWGADRRAALFFCSGQDHSDHVRDEVRLQGRTCESLTSRTSEADQRRILSDFRAGKLWSIASANMITTGANFPFVDLISVIRATKSPGLFVQILGRGTRNFPGKKDCLVLDHGGNLRRFGPIDLIRPKAPGDGDGEPPIKQCPRDDGGCDELVHISVMVCPCCGYQFPPSEEKKFTTTADVAPILSTDEPLWEPVIGRTFAYHDKPGGVPSVKVTYETERVRASEWVCPQHGEHPKGSYANSKANRWWAKHGGKTPFPKTVDEFLDRAGELLITSHVVLKKDGRYWNVTDSMAGESKDESYVPPPKREGNLVLPRDGGLRTYMNKEDWAAMDEIPF